MNRLYSKFGLNRLSIIHVIFLLLFSILLTSCSSTISSPPRRPVRTRNQIQLQEHAESFLGTPYRYGGSTRSGMDCSGFVLRIYRDVYGIKLPHKTYALYRRGTPVTMRSIRIGDLVFFKDPGQSIPSHVGVYVGNGRFIHASSSRGVIISRLSESYYRNRFVGARRIF